MRAGRQLLAGVVVWVFSFGALAAVIVIQHQSDSGRQAQVAVEQVRRHEAVMPGIVFAPSPNGGVPLEDVALRLAGAERRLDESLRTLQRFGAGEHTRPLPRMIARYLRDIDIVFSLVQNGHREEAARAFDRAQGVGGSSLVLRVELAAAGTEAAAKARSAQRLADIGTVLAVVALLLAFSLALLLMKRSVGHGAALGARNDDLLAQSRRDEARYRDLFENATEPIATVGMDWTLTDVNSAFERALGYTREELIGTNLNSYLTEEGKSLSSLHRDRKLTDTTSTSTYEQEFIGRDGRCVIFEVSTRLIEEDGKPIGVQGMCRDVTDRKRVEASLRRQVEVNSHQALHDALTGLPNRVSFAHSIEAEIMVLDPAGNGTPADFAVLMIDLDRFKEVNDSLGHHSGDRLLHEVGRRIRAELRGRDTVARLGGDEFGVLLTDLGEHSNWRGTVERITKALEEPLIVEGLPLSVEASIGVVFHPVHGTDVDQLLQRADVAMYEAKRNGFAFSLFDPNADRADVANVTLVGELRRAIAEGELVLHYQPKVDLRTGDVTRVEALIRWNHPEQGLLLPGTFMPVAEQTGLIRPLTRFVLEESVRQCREWELDGLRLAVAVNVSIRNLAEPDLVDDVARLLARWQLEPERLLLEVTESAISVDQARNERSLWELSKLGVKLALDDFGAGYTSISHLVRLPLDQIKIDRSFVERITTDSRDLAVVASIVDLAHSLGLEVVGEGVEEPETLEALRSLGCDHAQGYLLGRPLPPADLAAWVQLNRPDHEKTAA
jgi:diguanylate cyclase (GGDEF)-like protein/PAS domain S-box-containing protein